MVRTRNETNSTRRAAHETSWEHNTGVKGAERSNEDARLCDATPNATGRPSRSDRPLLPRSPACARPPESDARPSGVRVCRMPGICRSTVTVRCSSCLSRQSSHAFHTPTAAMAAAQEWTHATPFPQAAVMHRCLCASCHCGLCVRPQARRSFTSRTCKQWLAPPQDQDA